MQVHLGFPRFYEEVLDAEAAALALRRSQFLELLVRRKAGVVTTARARPATVVRWPKDPGPSRRYIWHCPPDLKVTFDALRARVGHIPPTYWFVVALHEWLGRPALP